MYTAEKVRNRLVQQHDDLTADGIFDIIMPDGLWLTLGRSSPRRGTIVAIYSHGKCFEKELENIYSDAEELRTRAVEDLDRIRTELTSPAARGDMQAAEG